MGVSFFKNDKNTVKDEIILSIILAITLALGIGCIAYGDEIWILSKKTVIMIGVMLITFTVMLAPSVAYRFISDISNKTDSDNADDNKEKDNDL